MNKLRLILSVAFLSFSFIVFSQTVNDAGDAFNNGVAHFKAKNYSSAIDEYKKCIEICSTLDSDEAIDLQMKAETQLTTAYLQHGKSLYRAKKLDNALTIFETAYEVADDKGKKAAKQYISRVYNSKGTAFYSGNKYAEAIEAFDKSIENDPKYVKALYGKSLVYRKQGDVAAYTAVVDEVLAMQTKDTKTVNKTVSTASKFFIAEGGKALQAQNFAKAVEMLNKGFEYKKGNGQAYYFAAVAYNGLKQWQKAIEAGNTGLTVEKKSKSNLNFEIAKAYEGMGNKAQARAFYAKVTDGPNAASAKYKLENDLK